MSDSQDGVAVLLRELAQRDNEIRTIRRQLRLIRGQKQRWKQEATDWKWQALRRAA